MSDGTNVNQSPVSPDLLEILRDPKAIQEGAKHGADPGRLELTRGGYWLVSADTGYKYPIRDGIPVMLVEEGAKWKDTPVDELPVPPPAAETVSATRSTEVTTTPTNSGPNYRIFIAAGALLLILFILIGLGRRKSQAGLELPPAE